MKKLRPIIIFAIGCSAMIIILLIIKPSTKDTPPPVSARVKQFTEYIINNIKRESQNTQEEDEIQKHIDSYNDDPALFNQWIKDLEADSVRLVETFTNRAKSIDYIDAISGKQVDFEYARTYAQNMDGKKWNHYNSNQQDLVMLKRRINRARDTFHSLYYAKKARACANEQNKAQKK